MPPFPQNGSPLAALGVRPDQDEVYRLVLRKGRAALPEMAAMLGRDHSAVHAHTQRLAEVGLVEVDGNEVLARPPAEALGRLLAEEARRLERHGEQLEALNQLLPSLSAEHGAAQEQQVQPVSLEVLEGGDVGQILDGLLAASTGDLMWLRPDQWDLADLDEIRVWTSGLAQAGRRSRVIYPARALEDAPAVVRAHAEGGEEVRILASVPTRLGIMGDSAALIPERWGRFTGRRLVVRQESLVMALREMFEGMWARAMVVPGLEPDLARGNVEERQLLLDQLAAGAKDEQIARALGLSLRTVRRRVAEILDELGAGSRFEAGVEAVRRGWI